MAGQDKTVDLTPKKGMDLRSLSKSAGSPFIQNVLPRNGEFLVRPGFGVVREYGTTLNGGRLENDPSDYYGIGAPIGKTEVRTSWGADQLIVVHPLFAFTGNIKTENDLTAVVSGPNGWVLRGVCAVVHDLNSGKHVEFVLHYQDAQRADLHNVYPHYSTSYGVNNLRWVTPAYEPKWATFLPIIGPDSNPRVLCLIDGIDRKSVV